MDKHILSVSALTQAIRERLESTFPFVWVKGQVTNVSRPASGHVYFSLRDDHSSLAAVWFKGSQKEGERFDPLTGEVYEGGPRPSLAGTLEDGQEIVCAGRIAVYAARGQYQLVVEFAQEAGIGKLHEEFERLRTKLAQRGYFAQERKRPLPPSPARVALVTSPGGAAVHDFIRIAKGRGLGADIRIYPAPVQGSEAAARIAQALERIQAEGWAEVAVLIRGGGSLEDLWAFNDEALAATIFTARIPVLAGIGHEVDVTLADMTADVRAATPSHAAQLLWPERDLLRRQLRGLAEALMLAEDRYTQSAERNLSGVVRHLSLLSPARRVKERQERLAAAARLLRNAARNFSDRPEQQLALLAKRLELGKTAIPAAQRDLAAQSLALHGAAYRAVERAQHSLETGRLRLEALNPLAPLERGYAMARKENGDFVSSVHDVKAGDKLRLVVKDGDIAVRVQGEIT